ncbi:hypothetical protein ACNKHP_15805 [Shigella boydii]
MARTALNVVGNALAVLVIAKWEHKFDRKKALAYEREVRVNSIKLRIRIKDCRGYPPGDARMPDATLVRLIRPTPDSAIA